MRRWPGNGLETLRDLIVGELVTNDPSVAPCGFDLDGALTQAESLLRRSEAALIARAALPDGRGELPPSAARRVAAINVDVSGATEG
jgi:hypothetical protein